jgi:hypothetical protein
MEGVLGRGGLIQAGGYVFRPYRRGGLIRFFNKGIYPSASRFRDEYNTHAALWGAGLPTVEPVGYAYRKRLWGAEGVFITRKADAVPWPKVWGSSDYLGNDSHGHTRQIAILIKAISAWGLWSPDMNATNFLLGSDGRILALDWDRARWTQKKGLTEPVAKPPVLRLAGGAKLRPAGAGFGVTPYESTNYRKLAKDGENEDG